MDKFVIKRDCFAFNGNGTKQSCACLKKLFCEEEKCKFYKTDISGKYDWQNKREV